MVVRRLYTFTSRAPPLQPAGDRSDPSDSSEHASHTREKFREQLRAGRLDSRVVEVDVQERPFPSFEVVSGSSVEEIDVNVKNMLPGLFQGRPRKRGSR